MNLLGSMELSRCSTFPESKVAASGTDKGGGALILQCHSYDLLV
jgi:hypothetical protein